MGLKYRADMVAELATNRRGRREEVLRELFFRAARRFTPALAAETDYGTMYVPTSDLFVGAGLFARGPLDADAVDEVLALARVERRRTFLEIGANIGSTTVPALKRSGFDRAIAIEPLPANVDILRLNLGANGLAERSLVLPIGVSDTDGEMELQIEPTNSGDNRLVNTSAAHAPGEYGEERRDTVKVPVRTVDALVADGTIAVDEVDLVWIDVQGHEGQVLAGATQLAGAPVVIEYWPYGLRRAHGLELLERIVAERYDRIVDLHSHDDAGPEELPASEVGRVTSRLSGIENTDLVLLPRSRGT